MENVLLFLGLAVFVYGLILLFSEKIILPSPGSLFLVLSLTLLSYAIRAERWRKLLERNGLKLSFGEALKTYIAGLAFIITPGKLGEVAKAQLMKERFGFPRKKGVFLTVVERAFDILANLLIASSLGIAVASSYLKSFLSLLLLLSIFFAILYLFRKRLRAVEEEISSLGDPLFILYTVLLSLIAWTVEGLEVLLLVWNFGKSISVIQAVFAFSASLILGNLSMLPGGLGGTEACLIAFLTLYGIEQAAAGSVTIAVRLATFWFGFALGSLLWFLLSKE